MSANDEWGAGDPDKWSDHGTVSLRGERVPLIFGENPHSRRDDNHYAMVHDGPVAFSGHRILIGVHIEMSNYLKDSHYSGAEIRKGGSGKILADGEAVFEFFTRDPQYALLKAHRLIGELGEHPSAWLDKPSREALVGRKVFYREQPAVIARLVVEQGCVILNKEGGGAFPPAVWAKMGAEEDDDDAPQDVKCEVIDPNIWWFRE